MEGEKEKKYLVSSVVVLNFIYKLLAVYYNDVWTPFLTYVLMFMVHTHLFNNTKKPRIFFRDLCIIAYKQKAKELLGVLQRKGEYMKRL